MEELATEGVHRNCLEIRNNIPNKDSVRVLHEVDLSTPVSTSQPPYISNSRKSATPGSVSRQLAASAMLSGASRLNAGDTPSSTSQSQSERNSSEKTASDCEATAVARTRGPTDGNFAADFGMADQLATNSKLVLEPRVRDKQSGKQRLFEVPLNDDASSGEDFPIPSTVSKRSGKRNRTRNGSSQKPRNQGHQVQASSADATVDDDTNNTLSTSTSNPNSNQRRPVGALPSLEDGLSSASPTESTEDEPDTDERTANGSGKQQQRRTRTKKRSIKQRTNPTEAQTQNNDTLLNLSLVREINDEIDSLKRTFLYEAAQHAAMSPETEVPTESACAIPQLPPPPSVNTSSNGDRRDVECVTNGSAKLIDTDTPTRAADSVPVPVPVLSNENKDLDNDATLPPMPTVTLNAHGILKNDFDSDEEEEGLMGKQYKRPEENRLDIPELRETKQVQDEKRKKKIREVYVRHPENPEVLLEGVLFRTRYLGSTQLISDTHTTKYTRMLQAQSALEQIKAPDGESQPSVDVELFVSADKLLILNTNLKEILMDHPLRTVSFIADIGDVVVIMARRRLIAPGEDGQMLGSPNSADEILPNSRNGLRSSGSDLSRSASGDSTASRSSTSDVGSLRRQIDLGKMQAKVVCHVIECDDAQLVAQSIGQAFQVAYVEFLKANGIDEPPAQADVDYQDVLNSQEMFNEELRLFTSTDFQKDVLIPKAKSEPLGVVIVESGWGSVIPTVVLANMDPRGAAARCGQLNIGDQIMSVNGISLVGLPLATCQNHIKNVRGQTSVKLAVISCPPVVEVLIKRPDPKYQLGFSVQNGVICSLLRGGIAERGGVRVGHRIIEINGQSVVAVQHEKIVQMLSGAVGEIHMRTMPTTIFRLLTGQDTPHYI